MQVVVLASQKGGSGKTTLSGHLAVEAERHGFGPVVLIDTDPQGSLSDWWNARAAETPTFARLAIDDLENALAQLREAGVKLVVIDTPPAITHSIASVVAHADLVVIPARPSPHDLRAVGATIDIAEHFGKPLVFVINAATARARITGESAVALSQHGTVAPVTLHHRVDFAASMVDGKTIGEIDAKSKSAREVSDLWAYLAGRLARLMPAAEGSVAAPRVATSLDALSAMGASASAAASEDEAEDDAPAPEAEAVLAPEIESEPEPEPEPEREETIEEVMSAIREGVSVSFAFDPAQGFDEVPVTAHLSPVPAPVWSPPPPPPPVPQHPRPTLPMARGHGADPRAEGEERGQPDRRTTVFGRRRAEAHGAHAAGKFQ
jgi:chromosome partitioning protein